MNDTPTRYTFIEQTKIQAQVLVPLIKAFQAEMGEERANLIAKKALVSLNTLADGIPAVFLHGF